MTDWAYEIAKELEKEIWHQEGDHRYPCEYGLDLGVVAAALRKAKADGMREAADMVWDGAPPHEVRAELEKIADAIEKGEP